MMLFVLAQKAYEAYKAERQGLTYDGKDIPAWDDVPMPIKMAWTAAVDAVVKGIIEYQEVKQ